ncbi:S-adenosyl-L-methionine-dependent methyltransferase [Aspergillus steynii IBT 23096]|uniref:phosphoethanolamine N-methyltransferase n=1 Tax=Aspergillus steynii IBT 23096 TaxID=1392250 RepID=A0A2I2GDE7_9EURO|nr:S-adenosyl-L-methionine-dependent methyltransferase [Aspergillus steynii IBT 23096]PLB50861.1 S-adenosyl-L-methionine-dependent methyltransferase [Aspergillus steynii IBT 23096]
MPSNSEDLYNQLGESYEKSYGDNPGQAKILDIVLQKIPPKSKILDVGCGTGKPMAEGFAQAGHEVHGIDSSQTMIDIARSQVKGHFERCNMTEYKAQTTFDVVLGSFSLFHITRDETYSMIFRFAEWLKPGGLCVMNTVLADYLVKDPKLFDDSGECVRHYPHPWMGNTYDITLFTRTGWIEMFEKAGLTFETEVYAPWPATDQHGEEELYLLVLRKTQKEPLFGPYPLPPSYGGPRKFNAAGVLALAQRMGGNETSRIEELLKNSKKLLDMNEPCRESLPYPDNQFDTVMANSSLQYVTDLDKSLHEMARVVDSSNPESFIIVTQPGPDSKVMNLINKVAVPLSQDANFDHHGKILHRASEIFAEHGFGNITVRRVEEVCNFPEKDLSARCSEAAKILAGLWFIDDPGYEKMQQALIPELELHFRDSPHVIGYQTVTLVARPTKS